MFDGFFYYSNSEGFDLDGYKYTEGVVSSRIFLEDLSFLRADAVFEVMEAKELIVFHEDEHLERLFNSAKEQALFIKSVSSSLDTFKEFFKERIQKVLKMNGNKSCTIRVMITGGTTWDEFKSKGPSVFIMTRPFKEPGFNEKGLKLLPVHHQREFPKIKSINYQFAERVLRQNPTYDDILYLKKNDKNNREVEFSWLDGVLESSRSNLFLINNDKIITPNEDILHGVTRDVLLKLAEATGYNVETRQISWGELSLKNKKLSQKSEVFLTNTTFFINPVRQIGDVVFPASSATKILWHLFAKYREEYYKE